MLDCFPLCPPFSSADPAMCFVAAPNCTANDVVTADVLGGSRHGSQAGNPFEVQSVLRDAIERCYHSLFGGPPLIRVMSTVRVLPLVLAGEPCD